MTSISDTHWSFFGSELTDNSLVKAAINHSKSSILGAAIITAAAAFALNRIVGRNSQTSLADKDIDVVQPTKSEITTKSSTGDSVLKGIGIVCAVAYIVAFILFPHIMLVATLMFIAFLLTSSMGGCVF